MLHGEVAHHARDIDSDASGDGEYGEYTLRDNTRLETSPEKGQLSFVQRGLVNYKREYRRQYYDQLGVSGEAEIRKLNKSSSSIDMDTVVMDPKEKWDEDDKLKHVDSEESEEEGDSSSDDRLKVA